MIPLYCFCSCTCSCSVSGILFHSPFSVLMTMVVLMKKDLKIFLAIARTTLKIEHLTWIFHSFSSCFCSFLLLFSKHLYFIQKWFITKFSMALLWLQRWSFLNLGQDRRGMGARAKGDSRGPEAEETWDPSAIIFMQKANTVLLMSLANDD